MAHGAEVYGFSTQTTVRAGRIKPSLDRTLPLRDASEPYRLIFTNQIKGNIVLLLWAEWHPLGFSNGVDPVACNTGGVHT